MEKTIMQMRLLSDLDYRHDLLKSKMVEMGWRLKEEKIDDIGYVHYIKITQPKLSGTFDYCSEMMGGIALSYVCFDDDEQIDTRWINNFNLLHQRFDNILKMSIGCIGDPSDSGKYTETHGEEIFSYSYWKGKKSYLVLMEHDEGDGNYGHEATLDFRLIPMNKKLDFPLETNLIF